MLTLTPQLCFFVGVVPFSVAAARAAKDVSLPEPMRVSSKLATCSSSSTHSHRRCLLFMQYSQLLEPLRPTSKPAARRLQELLACHKRFCEQQLANKKTSRVLEAAFDAEFTQQYMEQVCDATAAVQKQCCLPHLCLWYVVYENKGAQSKQALRQHTTMLP